MISVARKIRREERRTLGFVPTMGALHEGHLSLVREARAMCDVVVVSIFVNPTQFGPQEDFNKYPRDLTRDASLLAEYNIDYVFAPAVRELFPPDFSTYVTVEGLSGQLEGASRPGHFRGVATVVAILLNVVRPDFAFFGQKDGQQAAIIKRMVRDLAFDCEVVVMPIVREQSGLAMSSRNEYLDDSERRAAVELSQALREAQQAFAAGERDGNQLVEIVRSNLQKQPMIRLDYVSVNDAETFEKVETIEERPVLVSLAAYVGKTRLIDNVILKQAEAAVARI